MADCLQKVRVEENLMKCERFKYQVADNVRPETFSAVMEFNLVCEDEWIPRRALTRHLFLGIDLTTME